MKHEIYCAICDITYESENLKCPKCGDTNDQYDVTDMMNQIRKIYPPTSVYYDKQ